MKTKKEKGPKIRSRRRRLANHVAAVTTTLPLTRPSPYGVRSAQPRGPWNFSLPARKLLYLWGLRPQRVIRLADNS